MRGLGDLFLGGTVSLTPAASITLGNLRYTEQAVAVWATLALLPGVNHFTVTLPAGVRLEAAPDDDAVLEWTAEKARDHSDRQGAILPAWSAHD
jgi:hypothetical protein